MSEPMCGKAVLLFELSRPFAAGSANLGVHLVV